MKIEINRGRNYIGRKNLLEKLGPHAFFLHDWQENCDSEWGWTRTLPKEYETELIEKWFHSKQQGEINGRLIYDELCNLDLIRRSLSINDGINLLRNNHEASFRGCLWFSIACTDFRGEFELLVPCISENDSKSMIEWKKVDEDFSGDLPALLFPSKENDYVEEILHHVWMMELHKTKYKELIGKRKLPRRICPHLICHGYGDRECELCGKKWEEYLSMDCDQN